MKTIEYHSEDVTITHSTCTVFCEWDGHGQGFGNLCLDERTGPAFVHDLCEFFGVAANPGEEQAALAELHGQRVRALWYRRYGTMEGFELDGRRFLLWEWRRRTFPDAEALDPHDSLVASLHRQIASHELRLYELRGELAKVEEMPARSEL